MSRGLLEPAFYNRHQASSGKTAEEEDAQIPGATGYSTWGKTGRGSGAVRELSPSLAFGQRDGCDSAET